MLLWKKTRMTEYPKSTLRTLISLGKRGANHMSWEKLGSTTTAPLQVASSR